MKLTSFIGKQVLTPAGEYLGYVLKANVARDMKSTACFLLADADEEEFYLPAKNVLFSSDALIATRSRAAAPTGIDCPLGKAVYSHTGGFLGKLNEVFFGDGAEPYFTVNRGDATLAFPLSRVTLGDAIIVYPEGYKKPAPAKPAAKKKAAPEAKPVPAPTKPEYGEAEAEDAEAALPATADNSAESSAKSTEPFRREDALCRVNLLGRRVKKSVYDGDGCLIAEAGECITEAVVSRARRSNRLLALTVNTLTNVF